MVDYVDQVYDEKGGCECETGHVEGVGKTSTASRPYYNLPSHEHGGEKGHETEDHYEENIKGLDKECLDLSFIF